MSESIESLERQIEQLRVQVREAVLGGDRARASALRKELRAAEEGWEDALITAQDSAAPARSAPSPAMDSTGSLLPLREQVYEALSLLQVPAAPKLIATVHEAFFTTTFATTRVTSLRRDEERSFKSAPFARPYYVCAALRADFLSPSRGLLAVSTWPMEKRIIGSLSPRVDFLTGAIRVAEAVQRIPTPPDAAIRLLRRFASSIPGATAGHTFSGIDPATVRQAAEAELAVHHDEDTATRQGAARRARTQLTDAQQLFGARLGEPGVGDDDEEDDSVIATAPAASRPRAVTGAPARRRAAGQ